MSTRLKSQEQYAALLERYDTWMFDCDGVLWRGDHLIDGAVEVLDILRENSASTISRIDLSHLRLIVAKRRTCCS